MPCELTNNAVLEITTSQKKIHSYIPDTQFFFRDLYGILVSLPPLFSTFIGYAIVHPEINLNGLDCRSEVNIYDCWNDEHGAAFVKAALYPCLGYVISYPLLSTAKILAFSTRRELANNPYDGLSKVLWNLKFIENKTAAPPFNSVINALAMVFWWTLYTAIYAVVGNAVLGEIKDFATLADIAITYAIGAAVIPTLVASTHLLYRVCADGELSILPNPDYWQKNQGCSNILNYGNAITCNPVRWLSECCSVRAAPQQDLQQQVQQIARSLSDVENSLSRLESDDSSMRYNALNPAPAASDPLLVTNTTEGIFPYFRRVLFGGTFPPINSDNVQDAVPAVQVAPASSRLCC